MADVNPTTLSITNCLPNPDVNPTTSIITLDMNGLSTSIKRQRLKDGP